MGGVLFKRGERTTINSTVLFKVHCPELSPMMDLAIQNGLPLNVLSDHLHLMSSPNVVLLPEHKLVHKEMDRLVRYGLFQPIGQQSLRNVIQEFRRLFWNPVGTRPLMHFAAKFQVHTVPDQIMGLGSVHSASNSAQSAEYFPCLTHEAGQWLVGGVELSEDQNVSEYTFLAWR